MSHPRMWIVSLNYLDDDTAEFKHVDPSGGPSTAEFALPRGEWEAMDRPARLGITVQTDRPSPAVVNGDTHEETA